MKLDARAVKCAAANWLRYKRQFTVVAIEHWDMDICACDENWLIDEYEVKVRLDDLKSDIRKAKHVWYRSLCGLPQSPAHTEFDAAVRLSWFNGSQRARPPWVAARFFFVVPGSLLERARSVVSEVYPYAGLVEVEDHSLHKARPNPLCDVGVRRKAKQIHLEPLSDRSRSYLIKSMSASLCRTLSRVEELKEKFRVQPAPQSASSFKSMLSP